jgi:hypothetical protein
MIRNLYLLVAALMLVASSTAEAAWGKSGKIAVLAALDGEVHYYGQELTVLVQIINDSSDTLEVPSPSILTYVRIIGENGYDFTSSWIQITQGRPMLERLLPHDTMYSWHSVVPDYIADLELLSTTCKQLLANKSIRAVHAINDTSNAMPLDLVWPRNDELAVAESLSAIVHCMYNRNLRTTGARRLRELATLHPTTVYTQDIKRLELKFAMAVKDTSLIHATARSLINLYPNSAIALYAVDKVFEYSTPERGDQMLADDVAAHPNSLVERYYRGIKKMVIVE